MLSIQHVLSAVLTENNDKNYLDSHIAAVVYPDAIRAYSGPRQYSHFEHGSAGSDDTSWWVMPDNMKAPKEEVQASLKEGSHMAEYIPCVLGEETDINVFREHNKHLPKEMYEGVETHLKQDIVFDDFVREKIDCSRKYEDKFVFDGKEMDGKEVRGLIAQMEQQGIYCLSKMIYERTGELCNQEWLEKNVKPILDREYPPDLADKTFSYMSIDPEINRYITEKDWSHTNDGPLKEEEYDKLYTDVENYILEPEGVKTMETVEKNETTPELMKWLDAAGTSFKEAKSEEIDQTPEIPEMPKENYLDMKKNVKTLDEEMSTLKKELDKELAIGRMNGMTPETVQRVSELQDNIADLTKQSEKMLTAISSRENEIKDSMKNKARDVKEKVSGMLSSVKEKLFDKIAAGVATTKAIKDKVQETNQNIREKGSVSLDTMNVKLSESVHQIGRNYMAHIHEKDRKLSNTLDKMANTLEKAYERKANIKEAFKDLGRAIIGKERQNNAPEISPGQHGIVNFIRELRDESREEMKGLEGKFELSKEISLKNIESAMENRRSTNVPMKESKGLEKRFEQAKAQSIEYNSKRDQSPVRETKAKEQQVV